MDKNANNPNYLVKKAYLLLIACSTELENGIINLWKKISSRGRQSHPDLEDICLERCSSALCQLHIFQEKKHTCIWISAT